MTKRPRFASNMRLVADEPAAAIKDPPHCGGQRSAAEPIEPVEPQTDGPTAERDDAGPTGSEAPPDSLWAIWNDSVAAMSLTSYQNWHRGLSLQVRLSTYVLGIGARPLPPR